MSGKVVPPEEEGSENGSENGRAEGSEAGSAESFFFSRSVETQEEAMALLGSVLRAADPGAVYGEPQVHGKVTLITASEVVAGLVVGFGLGGNPTEGGGGGGGGGYSGGRPVAVISVGEEGVRVEPVVDVTKLGIAFFTTLGALFLGWRAMTRR